MHENRHDLTTRYHRPDSSYFPLGFLAPLAQYKKPRGQGEDTRGASEVGCASLRYSGAVTVACPGM